MPTEVIPLAAKLTIPYSQSRVGSNAFDLLAWDTYSQNMMFEIKEFADGKQRLHARYRPGFRQGTQVSTSANAQGIYYWSQTQRLYAVVNAKLLKSGSLATPGSVSWTDLGTIAGSTTSGCWFEEFYDGSTYYLLVKCENGDLYTCSAADAIAQVTDGDYTGLSAIGRVAVMDGYVFALKSNGTVAHSDLNSATAWTASSTIVAQERPDAGKCILRVGSYIVVFGEYTTEFFQNAGNATGSVLTRVKGLQQNIGCMSHDSVAKDGDTVYFAGKTIEGRVGIYKLAGTQITKISTPDVERLLGSSRESTIVGAIMPIQGRVYYVIDPAAGGDKFSLVYDTDPSNQFWGVWNTDAGSGSLNNTFSMLSAANGNPVAIQAPQESSQLILWMLGVYPLFDVGSSGGTRAVYVDHTSPVFYDGSSAAVTRKVTTDIWDAGTGLRKWITGIEVLGNFVTSSANLVAVDIYNATTGSGVGKILDLSSQNSTRRRGGIVRRARFTISFNATTGTLDFEDVWGLRINYEVLAT